MDENAAVEHRHRGKTFDHEPGAAPKERRALGAISGNVQTQTHAADKPAKRTSQRRSGTSKPKAESAGEQVQPANLSCLVNVVGIDEIKFDDIVDSSTLDDPQEVAGYVDDILALYRKKELKGLPQPGYMCNQPDINEKMREILIDWIIEVHMKFNLTPVTLYMTVQLIDRFLARKQVSRSKLQLVGITAMLIASKFEEIYPPEVKDFVYISDKAYTVEEITKMERAMLNALKFEIVFPSVHSFGKRFAKVARLDERTEQVAFYLIDLTLQEYTMLKYPPSITAAAGVNLAERLAKQVNVSTAVWSDAVAEYIDIPEGDLQGCMRDMHSLLTKERNLKAVIKKYSNAKYSEVAKSLSPLSVV